MSRDRFIVFVERMFGRGIYLTRVSSKADIYVDNVGASQNKRMIVNLVALGRSKLMYEESHDMQHAPPMCDSVWFPFHDSVLGWPERLVGHGGDVRTGWTGKLSRGGGLSGGCNMSACDCGLFMLIGCTV